jgi:hypothetical protein
MPDAPNNVKKGTVQEYGYGMMMRPADVDEEQGWANAQLLANQGDE